MPRNVSEQEIDALLGGQPARPPEVHARDFSEPRRLAASDLEALERSAQAAASAVAEAIRSQVSVEVRLDGVELGEANLEALQRDPAARTVATLSDGPAGASVVTLDLGAAVRVAQAALGAEEEGAPEARALSPVEARILERLLARVLEGAAQAFQVGAKDPHFLADRASLVRELRAQNDPRRVSLAIELSLGESRLVLHVFLAGVKPPAPKGAPAPKDVRKAALPAQIAPTHVELCAVLAQLELMLTDLLAIEPGDVIPLGIAPGEPIEIQIDGGTRARARFGERAGRLAVRITEVLRPPATR